MIKLDNISKIYDNGTRALRDVSLQVEDGEFVFVVGPSGSGKSTILKLLTGEVSPTAGSIEVNGFHVSGIRQREIPHLRRTIGVVFQDFRLIENKTVYENVAFVMRAVGAPQRTIKKRVTYVLDLVGVLHKARRLPGELSGGEQQRVAIARALVNNPTVVIADEPTGNLDPARSLELMLLLEKINALGTTVMVVTHERELVNQFEKRVVAIDGGQVISDRTGGYYTDASLAAGAYQVPVPGQTEPAPLPQPEPVAEVEIEIPEFMNQPRRPGDPAPDWQEVTVEIPLRMEVEQAPEGAAPDEGDEDKEAGPHA